MESVTKPPTRRRDSTFILLTRVVLLSCAIVSTWRRWQIDGRNLVSVSSQRDLLLDMEHLGRNGTGETHDWSVQPELHASKITKKPNDATTETIETKSNATVLRSETVDLVELSIRHVEPTSNISVAVCFKTLFGNIDIGIVLQWAGK
jgi:hypothetical protein